MNYHMYIDESGNTGNIEIKENLSWNFGEQTHFALGAIYVKENKQNDFRNEIKKVLHEYDPKLGDKNELKSTANYRFKESLLKRLINILNSYNVGFCCDIANKKYKVIMNIVEYCIYPYYFYNNMEEILKLRQSKANAATYLFNHMKMEEIKVFIDLCQTVGDEQNVIRMLLKFLSNLKCLFTCNKSRETIEILNNIEKIIEYTRENKFKEMGFSLKHILPIKDYNNKGTKESFLPNVDAYNNLVGLISKFGISHMDSVFIHHDAQAQFSNVLFDWNNTLKKRGCNIKNLEFCNSKGDILIQVSDFLIGTITKLYKEIISTHYINKKNKDLVKLLKPLLSRCNIVASKYEQKHFFDQCNMKYSKTPIPFL